MTGYVPYRTAAYLGEVNDVHHLYAVMNDPCNASQCLVINLTLSQGGTMTRPAS